MSSITDDLFKIFETIILCRDHPYNQSCLFKNLYYVNSTFIILTVSGSYLSPYSVQTDMSSIGETTPGRRVFDAYYHLETFVRNVIRPN